MEHHATTAASSATSTVPSAPGRTGTALVDIDHPAVLGHRRSVTVQVADGSTELRVRPPPGTGGGTRFASADRRPRLPPLPWPNLHGRCPCRHARHDPSSTPCPRNAMSSSSRSTKSRPSTSSVPPRSSRWPAAGAWPTTTCRSSRPAARRSGPPAACGWRPTATSTPSAARSTRWSSPAGPGTRAPRTTTAVRRADRRARRCAHAASPASAPARSCSPPPACSTAAARPPTGSACDELDDALPRRHRRARPDLRARRQRRDLGRRHRRHGPRARAGRGGLRRATLALGIARGLVLFMRRPGGQSQFSAQLAAQPAEREPLRELQAWIPDHLDEDLSVAALAARAFMSERNFARAFRRETGMTPAAHVEAARVERARTDARDDRAPDRDDRRALRLRHASRRCAAPSTAAWASPRRTTASRFRPALGEPAAA